MKGDHTRLSATLQSLIETYRCDVQADSLVRQADPAISHAEQDQRELASSHSRCQLGAPLGAVTSPDVSVLVSRSQMLWSQRSCKARRQNVVTGDVFPLFSPYLSETFLSFLLYIFFL